MSVETTEISRIAGDDGLVASAGIEHHAGVFVEDAARATPEESSRRRAAYEDPSTEELLTVLPALLKSADRVEAELATSVNRLRARGAAWHTIANAAGLSVEATRHRFSTAGVE